MSWATLNLELPKPKRARAAATAKKPAGPSGGQVYTRNQNDLFRSVWLDVINQDLIIQARRTASTMGNMAALGDVVALMRCIDPTIKAARSQRISAVTATAWEIQPADETPLALQIADEFRMMLRRPEADFQRFLEGAVDKRLEGGGLIENVWNDPAEPGPRYLQGFVTVPLQRLRYDRITGEQAFAERISDWKGLPVSSFEPGKFASFLVDEDILDFGERGTYRTLLSDFYARMNVFSWWIQGIERYGLPIIIAQTDNATERQELKSNMTDLGSMGGIIARAGTKIEAKYQDFQQGRSGSAHGEFLLKSDQRIFLAFLGESQTGMIEKGAGSKQSADTHANVARDVLEADWKAIEKVVRRDLAAPWTATNYGTDNLALTPFIRADIRDSVDLVAFGEAVNLALRNGVKTLPEDWYRDMMRAPKADEEQTVLALAGGGQNLFGQPADTGSPATASRRKRQPSLFEQMDEHITEIEHVADRYMRKGSRAMAPLFDLIEAAAQGNDLHTVKNQLVALSDTIAAASLEAAMQGVEAEKTRTKELSK